MELTLQQARCLQLAAQGLLQPPAKVAARADLRACIARMGLLQIDMPPIQLHASTQTDIRTPEKAAEVARLADGVVVGSALVDEIEGALNSGSNENVTERVLSKAAELAKAVRLARVRDA